MTIKKFEDWDFTLAVPSNYATIYAAERDNRTAPSPEYESKIFREDEVDDIIRTAIQAALKNVKRNKRGNPSFPKEATYGGITVEWKKKHWQLRASALYNSHRGVMKATLTVFVPGVTNLRR